MSGRSNGVTDAAPVRLFRSRNDWAAWLEKNHRNSDGLWLRLAKQASAIGDSTEKCSQWLRVTDGLTDRKIATRTRRGCSSFARVCTSHGSRINRGKALTLIESGIMQPAELESGAACQEGRVLAKPL